MNGVLVNRLGGLCLPRKSVVRLTDRPDMILDVYRAHKTTKQQQKKFSIRHIFLKIYWILEHSLKRYLSQTTTYLIFIIEKG